MEKLKMESADLTEQNIDKIGALFPNVITETKDAEGNMKKAINFALLQQMLQTDLVDGDECYDFTWVGKKQSIIDGNKPIRKTLRPCVEESKDWDKTENLFIEGDNLEVLKILQGSYLDEVKMIYIDPPYNTGNDFVYRDNFTATKEDYETDLGLFDEDENRLFQNNQSNGRFHSDWCSMLYPRLQLARNLLSDDGIIFISIDDNEVNNLKKICDEVFGEDNFIGCIVVKSNPRGSQSEKNLAQLHEYILSFSKNISKCNIEGQKLSNEMVDEYKYEDEKGKYRLLGLRQRGGFWRRTERPFLYYPIYVNPQTSNISLFNINGDWEVLPIQPSTGEDGTWRWGKEKFEKDKEDLIAKEVKRDGNIVWDIFQKDYLNQTDGEERKTKFKSLWDEKELNYQNGAIEVKELLNSGIFSFPKPTYLLRKMISMIVSQNDIVLDFFSGSSTTAHAVMQLNAEDAGKRRFLMVQLPEACDEKSEAYKAGYMNICEIGKERIRRAGEKIKEEAGLHGQNLDIGFRVLKLDSTNMKDVYYGAGEYSQQMLLDLESNIKQDRTDLDLLYGVLLDWGVSLALPHATETLGGVNVHFVNGVDLVACFAYNVNETVIREIAKRKPLRVVFRDSSFANSPDKINVTEIFKTISPETTVKVI